MGNRLSVKVSVPHVKKKVDRCGELTGPDARRADAGAFLHPAMRVP